MIDSETIRAARGGAVDESGRTHATAAENAADGDSAPLAGDSRDTRERIEADAWEAARLDMSRTWEERRDAIVALLDRQAALTEREACAYCDYKDANRRQAHKIHEVCKCLEDSHEREKKLQAEVDELSADNDYLQRRMLGLEDNIISLEAERDELRAELDGLRPPRIVEFAELESDEPPYDELLRCLENDWHISASWDGLRKFWNVELTEEGARLRDAELQAKVDELNAALGSGECEMAFGDDMLPECGNCGEPLVYYTKRHGFDGKDKRSASFCPRCGKAVKR